MDGNNKQRHQDDVKVKTLLGGMPLPDHAEPAPARLEFLNRAIATSQRDSCLLTRTKRRYLLVTAVGAAIAILVFASNYFVMPWVGWMAHPAWAAVDGFMLEYDRVGWIGSEYDRVDAFDPSAAEADTDLILATRVAGFLSKKYADLDTAVAGRPVLSFHSSRDRDLDLWHKRTYRFVALSDDPELLDELTEFMRENGAVSGPRVTPLLFYYRDGYSSTLTRSQRYFQQGRKIIVDGEEYRIPQDVDPEQLDRLQQEFEIFGESVGFSLRAYWTPGELYYSPRLSKQFAVGQLSTVELNDNSDLVVTTLRETLDIEIPAELYEGLGQLVAIEERLGTDGLAGESIDSVSAIKSAGCLPTIVRTYSPQSAKPRAIAAGTLDPVEEINCEMELRADLRRIAQERLAVHKFFFLVFPESSWQQVLDGTYTSEKAGYSALQANSYSQKLAETARAVNRQFQFEDHPECLIWERQHPALVDTLEVHGGPVLVIRACIYSNNEELAQAYKQVLTEELQLGEPLEMLIPAIPPPDGNAATAAQSEEAAAEPDPSPPALDRLSSCYSPRPGRCLATIS